MPHVLLLLLLVLVLGVAVGLLLLGALQHLVLDELGQVGQDELLLATAASEEVSRALTIG